MSTEQRQNILYSSLFKESIETEQITAEHSLYFVRSGELHFSTTEGIKIFRSGEIGLIRRNQLVKVYKYPGNDQVFQCISLYITQDLLRKYAAENSILQQGCYNGPSLHRLSPNAFLGAFFDSLLPYYESPEALNKPLAELKSKEAIELLLMIGSSYHLFMFDFSEPYKIDLETFMNKSFEFNAPISELARLSGRSVSTFKRDFKKVFDTTPEKWLIEKRLNKAHYLITEKKMKPSDVYLKVGFQNFSHFSKSFKAHIGKNPSQA